MKRLLLLAAMVVAPACSSDRPASVIDLDLHEFGISPSSEVFETGSVELRAVNSGQFAHTIVVTDASGEVVDASDLIAPDERLTVTVDLDEGTYRISCRIVSSSPDGELFDHYELGMITDVHSG